jgi:hypothetical protein
MDGTGVHKSSAYHEKVESFPPSSEPIMPLTDGAETLMISTDPHPDQNAEMDPRISKSSVPSTESTDAQLISTRSVQPVEIHPFLSRRDFTPHFAFSSMTCLPPD